MVHAKERKIAIVTDSTAYLPPEMVEQYAIKVVPLCLVMGDQTWLDGVEIDPPAFYQLLETSPHFPSTSQPNVATFQEVFARLGKEAEGIVGVFISDELSGTIKSAKSAAASLPDIPIEIVDSRGTSMMLGFPALAAARAAAEGGDLSAVAEAARALVGKSHLYFVVDTLEYLHRGGRIGSAAKFLGSALNLKPILEIEDGKVEAKLKVRTKRKALLKVFDLLQEHFQEGDRIHMAVFNVAALAEAERFRDELVTRFQPIEIMLTEVSPVIGAHAGPGAVGVAFYTE